MLVWCWGLTVVNDDDVEENMVGRSRGVVWTGGGGGGGGKKQCQYPCSRYK